MREFFNRKTRQADPPGPNAKSCFAPVPPFFVVPVLILLVVAGCENPGRSTVRDLPPYLGAYPSTARSPVRPTKPARPIEKIDAAIVIDAGHGGRDPGARGLSISYEKKIVLEIAKKVASSLKEYGAEVAMTRNDDRFVELDDRAAMAARLQADLFISIHADSAQRVGASGSTVFIARAASGKSRHAARKIVEALEKAGIECRGVKKAGFRVLVGHPRPAVLVECGFLTNPRDARLLNTPSYQARVAAAIPGGIVTHFSEQ